ncbi:MAG: hypothetical protein QOF51_154 [Chloroflexota bacterium]|jgi:hypothetical protein|nr:hypothetical protein [Chloroflexota bacterium]
MMQALGRALASVTLVALVAPTGLGSPQRALAPVQVAASVQTSAQENQPADPAPFAERALAVDRMLAETIGIRPAGSDAERRAAAYLSDELSGMGYAVDVAPFPFSARGNSGTSQNVVAMRPDEDPTRPLVIVGAHYDSVPQGPGANDNGSGTSTMIEVARELSWNPVPGVDVRYVAFGAEEIGLLGSADYVRRLSATDRDRLKVMMSLDMLSVGDNPAFAGTEPWVSLAMTYAASQGYEPLDLTRPLRGLSDHASFINAGLPAVMFYWSDDPEYHTIFDVWQRVQPWSMDLMGSIAIQLVRHATSS